MMRRLLAAAIVASVTGCMPYPPGRTVSYHAIGTEPFWSLTIGDKTMAFTLAGQQPIVQPKPRAIVGIAGEIYRTPRIDANVVHAQCSDGMSDHVYPDKVQVTVDGHRYNGCGGL